MSAVLSPGENRHAMTGSCAPRTEARSPPPVGAHLLVEMRRAGARCLAFRDHAPRQAFRGAAAAGLLPPSPLQPVPHADCRPLRDGDRRRRRPRRARRRTFTRRPEHRRRYVTTAERQGLAALPARGDGGAVRRALGAEEGRAQGVDVGLSLPLESLGFSLGERPGLAIRRSGRWPARWRFWSAALSPTTRVGIAAPRWRARSPGASRGGNTTARRLRV
jgi:hypothetical protein